MLRNFVTKKIEAFLCLENESHPFNLQFINQSHTYIIQLIFHYTFSLQAQTYTKIKISRPIFS